jgi:hypothetical protein
MTMADSNQELLENWPYRPAVRRDTLLEDWPRRKSSIMTSSSFDSDSLQGATHKSHRVVRFSDASQLYVYERHSISLLRSLAYTKENRDEFGNDALAEGLRIKQLIAMSPCCDSTAESLKFLLQENIISKAELVGIEHFFHGRSVRVAKVRKQHSDAVLKRQWEQRHRKLDDQVIDLGKFAQKSSHKSTKSAIIRAAVAA